MKRSRKFQLLLGVAALLAVSMSCNLPNRNSQPTPSEPTPNMTMTALFSFSTPADVKPTITPRPTATEAPALTDPTKPMATLPPTITQVPQAQTPTPELVVVQPTFLNPLVTPTVTSTAEARKAGLVSAFKLNQPPKLDGVWDEWTITANPATWVVWGKQNWTGKEDFEGSYRIGYDDTNLYLALKVYDDVYVQEGTGRDIYKGDSFELLFDRELQADIHDQSLNGDDYQIILSPGRGGPGGPVEAYQYHPTSLEGTRKEIHIACQYQNKIHRCEAAIPWTVLGLLKPERGSTYGFAISPSDNDEPGTMQQQTVISNSYLRRLTDPTTWLQLVLK